MRKCKITVVKKTLFPEIVMEYANYGAGHPACPFYEEGQVFISNGLDMPDGFCSWAWGDLVKFIHVMLTGGTYARMNPNGTKDGKVIACCSDGYRPVVFLLEGIEVPE